MNKPLTFHELLREQLYKFNDVHDPRNGQFAPKNGGGTASASQSKRKYGKTDVSDALDEIKSGKKNSLSGHIDKNGNLSPEREKLHKEIIDTWLKGKTGVEGQAEMRMMGGGPASGKSSVEKMGLISKYDEAHHVKVDPDEFKAMLPGYKEMTKTSDEAASFYHEESSALAKRAYAVALGENLNITYDGTGDGSVKSASKKIDAAKEAGYKVKGEYVTINTDEALRRNQKRYDDAKAKGEPARLPPKDYVVGCHAKVTDVSVQIASKFDEINIWDNNGPRGSTRLIASGGSGKGLVAKDKKAFNDYLNKGTLEFITLPNGQVVPKK